MGQTLSEPVVEKVNAHFAVPIQKTLRLLVFLEFLPFSCAQETLYLPLMAIADINVLPRHLLVVLMNAFCMGCLLCRDGA